VGKVSVDGFVEMRGEPIRNPVTCAEHRARIDLPNGFEYTLAEMGSGSSKTYGPQNERPDKSRNDISKEMANASSPAATRPRNRRRQLNHRFDPGCYRIQRLGSDLSIAARSARGHMKRMIGIVKQLESCPGAELLDERL
jgi:hypothetical protein